MTGTAKAFSSVTLTFKRLQGPIFACKGDDSHAILFGGGDCLMHIAIQFVNE